MGEKDIRAGSVCKVAKLQANTADDEAMLKINKFTLSPLTAEEVFTFKAVMGDTGDGDRNNEPFALSALKDLKELYVGKPMIKDHSRKSDNQVARIYDTELVTTDRFTKFNEPITQLVAYCYMVKTTGNADLITEISAGIKKEVSTSFTPKKAICSICGRDNVKDYCSHFPGREYERTDGTKAVCNFILDGAKEAYELSLVVVPAQPRAGTCKNYGTAPFESENPKKQNTATEDSEIDVRIKLSESFIFNKTKEELS